MKRFLTLSSIFLMIIGIMAFECDPKELTEARMEFNKKNYEEAKTYLEKAIEKNPNLDEAYYLLGQIYGEDFNGEKMIENFDKSLSIRDKYKKDIDALKYQYWALSVNAGVENFNAAIEETEVEKATEIYEDAINKFENAILIYPDSLISYQSLAFSYINAGRKLDAIKPLTVLVEKENSEDAYIRLGDIYYNEGVNYSNAYGASGDLQDSLKAYEYYNNAIDILEKAKTSYPDNKDILVYLSNAYIATNQFETARKSFVEGIAKDPQNKYYRYNYGFLLLEVEKFEAAAKQFESAIEIDSEYSSAIYNLSVTYVKWGAKLREEAEQAESGDKSYIEKFNMALDLMQDYLEIEEPNKNAYNLLGTIYANLGENEKSLEAYNKADSLN